MEFVLVPLGTVLGLAGVAGMLMIGPRARRLRAAADPESRAMLKRLTFLNGASTAAVALGVAFIVLGRLMG